jgi:immune inhibitor A
MFRTVRAIWCCLAGFCLIAAVMPMGDIDKMASRPQGLYPVSPHPDLLKKYRQEGGFPPVLQSRLENGIDRPRQVVNPPVGNFNILAVPVDFSGKPGTIPSSFFDNLIFALPPPTSTVTSYFLEISYGALTIVTQNPPSSLLWQQAPLPYNTYVNSDGLPGTADDYGFGTYPQNLQGLAEDILAAIDPLVNFAIYDNDGDGFVEGVTFIHSGAGAEITGSPNDIWSSAWDLTSNNGPGPYQTQDGVWVDSFTFDPEFMYTPGDQTIGVYCHELGHSLFGLPDLYDIDLSSNGVGTWSLMSYGSWNGPSNLGSSPAWPDAWSRTVMGFETPIELTGNQSQTVVYPVQAPNILGRSTYRLRIPQFSPGEYFLIENRMPVSYDRWLPGIGLLIWHIDEEKWNWWEGNQYECTQSPCCGGQCPTWHPLVALEQADGQLDLELAANFGDAGDPFPGVTANPNFGFGANPESGSWIANPCPSNSCISVNGFDVTNYPIIRANLNVVCTSTPNGCLNLLLDEQTGWGKGGGQVSYQATVQNCGIAPDPSVTIQPQSQWSVSFFDPNTGQPLPNPPVNTLNPGQGWDVGVLVSLPNGIIWGEQDVLTLTALSSFPGVSASGTLTTSVPQCVLVVDDDRSMPDVEGRYLLALDNQNIAYDYWDSGLWGIPSQSNLNAHSSIIWFTGKSLYETLTPRDELALGGYLSGGGNLFLSSQDYLYDVGRSAFNRSYLRLGAYVDDSGTTKITGMPGDPVGNGLGPYTLSPATTYSDRMLSILLSTSVAFLDDNNQPNGLTFDSGMWKTLFITWPFENLLQPDADQVMAAGMEWFDVPAQPSINFSMSSTAACVGEPISFFSQAQDVTTFLWEFGDGITSTLTDTIHIFQSPMTYTIKLTGANCCGQDLSQHALPVYYATQASFQTSANIFLVGETVVFTSTSQYARNYLWDFGDGVTSTLPNPTHVYTAPIQTVVTLTVDNPCSSSIYTKSIVVSDVYRMYLPAVLRSSTQILGGQVLQPAEIGRLDFRHFQAMCF